VARAKDPAFATLGLDQQQAYIKDIDESYMKRARDLLLQEDISIQVKLEAEAFRKGSSGLYKQ
jgi:hypothetical protein